MKILKFNPFYLFFVEEQLITICVDLFLAGTETTASKIGFTLRYLVWYPEIQEKVRQELYRVVGKDRIPSMDDMPKYKRIICHPTSINKNSQPPLLYSSTH
jgi:cytochrome P450